MGKVLSLALRPIKNFNIENRAHRVISKEKPTAAPHYPGNLADIQRALEAEPDLVEKLRTKDDDLDNRLRAVFVTSKGSNEDVFLKQRHNPNRPLPQDRDLVPDFEYGHKEPDDVPYGKTTLRNVLKFVSEHQVDPERNTAAKIALEQKLKEDDVSNILKYFKTFEIFVPATAKSEARFAGPSQMRKLLKAENRQISDKDSKAEQA